jgi:phenol 2-monooxygenase
VIEALTAHSAPRQETTVIFDFPAVFRPWDERDGWDYWKIFADDQSYHEGHGHAGQHYSVDPEKGCAVVLWPDQYVSFVTEVDDYEGIDHFFSGFTVEQKLQSSSCGKGREVNGKGGAFVNGGSGENGLEARDEAAKGTGGS